MRSPIARKILNGTCENVTLSINEACLNIHSRTGDDLVFFAVYDECDMCGDIEIDKITPLSTNSFILNTIYPIRTHFNNQQSVVCYNTYGYMENGVYGVNYTSDSCGQIWIEQAPNNVAWDVSSVFLFYFLVLLFLFVMRKCYMLTFWRRWFRRNHFNAITDDLGNPDMREATLTELARRRKRDSRVTALDCMRGIAIVSMIFVNYGGGKYSFFEHIPWNGMTIADLVFPWFVWTMGFSIAISLRSQLRTSVSRKTIFFRVVKRSFILINLGILMNSGKNGKLTDLYSLRYPGVLQRLGLTYLVVASVETIFMKPQGSYQYGPWSIFQDILESWFQWLIVILLAVVNVLVSFLLHVPGCPTGYLGPGGLHMSSKYTNCTGGAAGYIDRLVFGVNHIYQHPTSEKVYMSTRSYDPEGVLGLLTSILLAYIGVHTARIMFCYHHNYSRMFRWSAWGLICGVTAGLLCNWSKEDGIIPVNKNLWSLSYVLACGAISLFMFVVLYILIDYEHWWSGMPFIYPGMNAILLYIGHIILSNRLPFKWQPILGEHFELLAMDLYGTSLWVVFSYFCYTNNFFVSL